MASQKIIQRIAMEKLILQIPSKLVTSSTENQISLSSFLIYPIYKFQIPDGMPAMQMQNDCYALP